MKYSLSIAALAASSMVSAGPVKSRQAVLSDIDILNYALTLEHLEDTFYRNGLKNYTQAQFAAAGYDASFYANLNQTAFDEKTHVAALTKALGSAAVAECTYSFPSTDVDSFVALAAIFEGIGVSAYIGAAAYISDPEYLTIAASILAVEARHTAYLRASNDLLAFPQPFDTPLSFDSVYTLAANFIVSCPSTNRALPFQPFPQLALGAFNGPIVTGSTITLLTPGYILQSGANIGVPLYAAFLTLTGPIYVPAPSVPGGYSAKVPAGVSGQTYVVLTACNTTVNDNTIVAGPAVVEISSIL